MSAYVCRFIVTRSFAKFKENLVIKEQQRAIFGYLLLVMPVLTTASYYLWEYFAVRHLETEFLPLASSLQKKLTEGKISAHFVFRKENTADS